MKYLKQLVIILLFSFLGELLQELLPLPVPAAIYGLLLLFLALTFKIVKPESIKTVAGFLLNIMPLLFVAPGVNILSHWGILAPEIVPIVTVVLLSTVIVFAVSGLVTKALLGKGGKENG